MMAHATRGISRPLHRDTGQGVDAVAAGSHRGSVSGSGYPAHLRPDKLGTVNSFARSAGLSSAMLSRFSTTAGQWRRRRGVDKGKRRDYQLHPPVGDHMAVANRDASRAGMEVKIGNRPPAFEIAAPPHLQPHLMAALLKASDVDLPSEPSFRVLHYESRGNGFSLVLSRFAAERSVVHGAPCRIKH